MRQRWLFLCLTALLAVACSEDKSKPNGGDDDTPDSGIAVDSGSHAEDAGTASALPRPALERPPINGLPADLRPPR
jgi:hypothetical protein